MNHEALRERLASTLPTLHAGQFASGMVLELQVITFDPWLWLVEPDGRHQYTLEGGDSSMPYADLDRLAAERLVRGDGCLVVYIDLKSDRSMMSMADTPILALPLIMRLAQQYYCRQFFDSYPERVHIRCGVGGQIVPMGGSGRQILPWLREVTTTH